MSDRANPVVLVKRLRREARMNPDARTQLTCNQAADEIERAGREYCDLKADRDALKEAVSMLRDACAIAHKAVQISAPGGMTFSSSIGVESVLRFALKSTEEIAAAAVVAIGGQAENEETELP